MSLRDFLGYQFNERPPDHSSFTIWRQRLSLALYRTAFQRVLGLVHRHGLIDAHAAGLDSSTIEADVSLRRVAGNDNGASCPEYVRGLTKEAGEDLADAAAVARFDKKRKGKSLSNKGWQSKTEPDPRIAEMKNGALHLAYKPQHAVDPATGTMLGVNVYPADQGDTACVKDAPDILADNLAVLGDQAPELLCVVINKGYPQSELIKDITIEHGITTYIPERNTKQRRHWHGDSEACHEFHANRRRTGGNEGKRLERLRAELAERRFALSKYSGNLGRMTIGHLKNVTNRCLIHAPAYNLDLVMRPLFGQGTPKGMADGLGRLFLQIFALLTATLTPETPRMRHQTVDSTFSPDLVCFTGSDGSRSLWWIDSVR